MSMPPLACRSRAEQTLAQLLSHSNRRWRQRPAGIVGGIVAAAAFTFALAGCSGDSPVALRQNSVFWAVKTDVEAASIVLGGTQQLTATPLDPTGAPIPELPAPTFVSLDPAHVTVSSTGLVTGVAVTPGVSVVASLKVNGVTNTDTTVIAVTPTTSVLGTFRIDTTGPFFIDKGSTKFVMPIVNDDHGIRLANQPVKYTSLNPLLATVQGGAGSLVITANAVGQVRIAATTTAYGVTKVDTVAYTIRYPLSLSVTCLPLAQQPFLPAPPFIIGTGGTVTLRNGTSSPLTITFTGDTTNVSPASTTLSFGGSVTFHFPVAGVYNFLTSTGLSAGILVIDQ
jgi:hypothetical protein